MIKSFQETNWSTENLNEQKFPRTNWVSNGKFGSIMFRNRKERREGKGEGRIVRERKKWFLFPVDICFSKFRVHFYYTKSWQAKIAL